MRVLRHYTGLHAEDRGSVAVLGNFDGVHRGHQAVIAEGRDEATKLGCALSIVTFEPHPRRFFQPDALPFRLTTLRSKAHFLARRGVDLVFALHFDHAFSLKSAEQFVREVLVQGLAVRHVVVGYDFVFGHKRGGNAETLRQMGAEFGFGVTVVSPVSLDGETYSSTRIRELLTAGEPRRAAELLGHWWEVEGRVETGDKRGRTIGFPTANIDLDDFLQPRIGVYAVRAGIERGDDVEWHDAVANFGQRPTFDKQGVMLEVHLLDFGGDLYGQHLRVAFVDFIRPERKFAGIDQLRQQIALDAAKARQILADSANARDRFD